MARAFGVFWLVCALIGAIWPAVALPFVAWHESPDDWGTRIIPVNLALGFLLLLVVVMNLVHWGVAWLYVWSYRSLCRSQAQFALKSVLPMLLPNAPLLFFAGLFVVMWLGGELTPLQIGDVLGGVALFIGAVCATVFTVHAWSHRQRHLHLGAVATTGVLFTVLGLVVTPSALRGSELGVAIPLLGFSFLFNFPGFWMAVAFLRCLKTESAAQNTS